MSSLSIALTDTRETSAETVTPGEYFFRVGCHTILTASTRSSKLRQSHLPTPGVAESGHLRRREQEPILLSSRAVSVCQLLHSVFCDSENILSRRDRYPAGFPLVGMRQGNASHERQGGLTIAAGCHPLHHGNKQRKRKNIMIRTGFRNEIESVKFTKPMAFACAAALIVMGAKQMHAFNPQPDPPAFPLAGMAVNETARLNVVCVAQTVNGVSPGPCHVSLGFYATDGRMIATTVKALAPGEAASLDLPASQMAFGRELRIEVAPRVATDGVNPVVANVEVFDPATGRTNAVYGAAVPRIGLLTQLIS